MTKLLQEAFDEVSGLPEDQQDKIAAWLIRELREERRWDESFAKSHGVLETLANEALAEYRAGKTEPLDPGSL